MSAWQVTLLLVPITLIATALACGAGTSSDSKGQSSEMVHGLVRAVQTRSLLELESLTVEDDDGTEWRFEARGRRFADFTPSHLREHMVLGVPVTATFHRENGVLVLDDITD